MARPIGRTNPRKSLPSASLPTRHAESSLRLPSTLASAAWNRSEEHTSELQSLMRISYAVFCLKKKKQINTSTIHTLVKQRNDENHEQDNIYCETVVVHAMKR